MSTITAFKFKHERVWKNDFEYEIGPTMELESESLDRLAFILKPIWEKGWEWVIIETIHSKYKIFSYDSPILK